MPWGWAAAGAVAGAALSADTPDTSGMNAAAVQSAEVSKEQLALAREQYADAKARQATYDPIYMQLLQDARAQSQTAQDRSTAQWNNYTSIFLPLEKQLASTASNWDTAGRRDQAAADAVATVSRQMEQTRAAQQRGLQRAGVQLGSGRALTLDNASRLAEAKAAAGADYAARKQVESQGISLVDNAAKFGRGLTSTGLSAAQMGLSGNQVAQGAGQTGQAVYNSTLNPSLSLYNASSANNATAASMYGNIYGAQAAQQAAQMQTIGSLAGAAGYAYGSGGFSASSKTLKTDRRRLGLSSGKPGSGGAAPARKTKGLSDVQDAKVLRERTTSTTPTADKLARVPVETWRYRKGLGDQRQHVGPMAEEVQREFGDAVAPAGLAIHKRSMAEVNDRAVSELLQEVRSMRLTARELRDKLPRGLAAARKGRGLDPDAELRRALTELDSVEQQLRSLEAP